MSAPTSEPPVEPPPQPLDWEAEAARLRLRAEELTRAAQDPQRAEELARTQGPPEPTLQGPPEPHPAASGEPDRRANGQAGPGRPAARPLRGTVHDRTVNHDRGEVQVELDGKLWILTPTPWASRAIEQQLPWSLTRLLTYAARGDLKLEEIALIVHEGMRATGDTQADFEGVCKLVWAEGQGKVAGPISLYLHNCLTGGRPPAKKKTPSSASHTGSG